MFCGNGFKCDNCYDVCPDKTPLPNWGRISVLSSNMITVSDVVYVLWFAAAVPSECKQRVSETHGNEEWIAFVPEKN